MKEQNNPLLCDIKTGICEMPQVKSNETVQVNSEAISKPVKVIYFTDPICSSCWGIEPQLRKLKLEYGDTFEIDYRMGGLLPNWNYNSGSISKPSDVAQHWDDVSVYYDMPIDGDVWLEDPLVSSYPSSMAFKAAEMQDKEKAISFLREIREMVFLQKKNITRREHLEQAAQRVGLDLDQFKYDYIGKAKELFNQDLELAKELGVRGFPSLFFIDVTGNKEFVYGSQPYSVYEKALLTLAPTAKKLEYDLSWGALFDKYPTISAKEFTELSGTPRNKSEQLLNELAEKGKLEKWVTKNGSIWKLKMK